MPTANHRTTSEAYCDVTRIPIISTKAFKLNSMYSVMSVSVSHISLIKKNKI